MITSVLVSRHLIENRSKKRLETLLKKNGKEDGIESLEMAQERRSDKANTHSLFYLSLPLRCRHRR